MDQMTAFLQSFQQVASGSSRQSDRRKLLKDFKEQDPPSFDVKLDPAAELWIESVEKKLIFWISSSSNSWSSGEGRFSPYGARHNCGQVGHFRCNCPQLQRQQQQSAGGFNHNRPMFQQSPAPSYASASQPRGPQQNFYCQ